MANAADISAVNAAVAAVGRDWAAGERDLYAAFGRAVAALTPADGEAAGAAAAALLAALPDGEPRTRLHAVDPQLLAAVARAASGHPAVSGADSLPARLLALDPAPVFPGLGGPPLLLPLSTPGMPDFADRAFDAWFAATGAGHGIGLYGEDRNVYRSAQFADPASPERRTFHLGLDVFAPAGTPLHAPLEATVHWVAYNADPLDFGNTLLLRHEGAGVPFFTLYGHLGGSLPRLCRPGQRVAKGQLVAHLGDWHENGDWSPHVHFQVLASTLAQQDNFFGVGHRSLWPVWQAISPDPSPLMRIG